MKKKVLLLGCSGKMGVALNAVFLNKYYLEGKNSKDFDAAEPVLVRKLIQEHNPDIVINTVASLGIEPCEKDPVKAFKLNTLFPKLLAELATKEKFLLVHFSTDGVFNDEKRDFYTESDRPSPLHVYGLTKYGGDCFMQALAKRYYIVRIPILFGQTPKKTQFVEKMLDRIEKGEKTLMISNDIVSSPTYSQDVAVKVKEIIENELPWGLYHVANQGKASLYDLIKEIVANLSLNVNVKGVSHTTFQAITIKNTYTPITSEKIKPLRPWKEALQEYCRSLKAVDS